MHLPDRARFRELTRVALSIFSLWMLFAAWNIFKLNRRADDVDIERVAPLLVYLMVMAVFTPLVVYVAQPLPIRRPRRIRNLLLLTVSAIVLASMAYAVWIALIQPAALSELLFDPVALLAGGARASIFNVFVILLVVQYLETSRENAARRRAEAEIAAEVSRAQLQQLRADLNPHFLFNSLNSVLALVRDEPPEAERMLRILSDLLRRSFTWLDSEITLGEEVRFATAYLEVQKMRFRDRLSVAIHIPAYLEDALVPPLILQPLVENAVIHGVARLPGPGSVALSAHSERRHLVLTVRDSGSGFIPSENGSPSIGIPNTRARLRLIYGDDQSIDFRRQLDGFVVEIILPLTSRASKVPV